MKILYEVKVEFPGSCGGVFIIQVMTKDLLYFLMIREEKSYHRILIGRVEYVNGKWIFSSVISLTQ